MEIQVYLFFKIDLKLNNFCLLVEENEWCDIKKDPSLGTGL